MNGANRGSTQGFEHEIAIGHAVERICRRAVESKRFCGHRPVDGKRGSGQRGGAERRFIEAGAGIAQSRAVARKHFHIGQEMMAEGDGLCRLQMRKPWHHACRMGEGLLGERFLQVA